MSSRINVTRSSMPLYEEYAEEIQELWESHWLTNLGVKHQKLEEQLINYLDVPYVNLFTNGHLALEYAIEAFELKGEVITTPFTFASTTHAIVRKGLTPVFCDIDMNTYTIDVNKLESLITAKTSAILPVHVYGNVCDVEAIETIAQKYDLKVIYDAAHAFGVTVNGRGIASFGDATMFSFHATKVFNTIEGGAVTHNNIELEKKLNKLKNFGITGLESVECVGGNAKMNEFQAAMGICNLRHINNEIDKRRIVVEQYNKRLKGIEGIRLVDHQAGVKQNFAYYPVLFKDRLIRDGLCEYLNKNNIKARKYFYPLTNDFEFYKDMFSCGETPIAKYVSERILTLPLYADLALKDVEKICDTLVRFLKFKSNGQS